jgi:uncharacterized protein YciI
MSLYAVTREAGPGWTDGGIAGQADVSDHATFMNALTAEGLVLMAGPVAGTEGGRARILLVMAASSEAEIRRRLADDPWAHTKRLLITTVEPWNLVVGGERVSEIDSAPL